MNNYRLKEGVLYWCLFAGLFKAVWFGFSDLITFIASSLIELGNNASILDADTQSFITTIRMTYTDIPTKEMT